MNAMRTALSAALMTLVSAGLVSAQPGAERVVAEVVIRGNKQVPTPQILNHVQTRAGQPYRQDTAQADVTRLMQTKLFADVRVSLQANVDGRIIAFYDIQEHPSVVREIRYDGAKHFSEDDLKDVTGLRTGVPLNPVANKLAVQSLLRKYQDDGRLFAHVELVEGANPGDTRVVFRIAEGPELKVSSVHFTGNTFASGERLKTQIQTSRGFLGLMGGKYVPAVVEFDRQKIEDYYRTFGYHEVQVSIERQPNRDHSSLDIIFHIDEGERFRVKSVQLVGNKEFSDDRVLGVTKLRAGETYDRNTVQRDLNSIRALYGYTGRMVAPREQIFTTGPGEVTVQYEVQERPPSRVGQVTVIGNDVTKSNIILRQVPLYPGQTLSYPDIQAGENALARLNIFETDSEKGTRPTITVLDPDGDNPIKDILVQVQETSTGQFMLGVGVNSDAGLTGNIVLNERNFDLFRPPTSLDDLWAGRAFRGAGQEFRLEAQPGTQFQKYSASLREPSLFDSPYSLATSAYYYQRGYAEYNEQRTGGRFQLGRRIAPQWTASASLRIEGVEIYDVPDYYPAAITDFRGNHLLIGLKGEVQRDSRDSYLRPTEGSMVSAGVEGVTGDYTFPVFTAEASKFFTTYQRNDGSGRHVLAFKSQLSITNDQAPIYEKFYAGGFRSLRGFEFRGVGPFTNGLNVGGEFSFLNSVEYQIPLVASDQLYAVGFIDSGSVERDVSIRNYRVTAGLGLRIVVPMLGPVPIALDLGVPLSKGPDDRKQLFSFWLGFFN